jgi:hypothetical protein
MTKLPMNTPPEEPHAGGEGVYDRPSPDAAIRNSVITSLGRPPELYRVAVMPLWGNRYRVNVLVGADPTSVRIAHSYFVEAGAAGNILTATPRITRLYE